MTYFTTVGGEKAYLSHTDTLTRTKMTDPILLEYWRKNQRRYRARLRAAAAQIIETPSAEQEVKPRILLKGSCSLCGQLHPVEVLLGNGDVARFSLDSFHSKQELSTYAYKVAKLYTDHVNACHSLGLSNVVHEFTLPYLQCISSRKELYGESDETASHNCSILLSDPLYRHFPPGLIVPVQATEAPDPTTAHVDSLVAERVSREGEHPKDARVMCNVLKQKPETDDGLTVGNLYGKTREEVAAMSRKPDDPNLTVGSLYGKTRKEIERGK